MHESLFGIIACSAMYYFVETMKKDFSMLRQYDINNYLIKNKLSKIVADLWRTIEVLGCVVKWSLIANLVYLCLNILKLVV